MRTRFYGRYSAWLIVAVIFMQALVLRFVWQLESDDPIMGIADAGFLLLPFSVSISVISWHSLENRRWLRGAILLLVSLPGLAVGSLSLYFWTL